MENFTIIDGGHCTDATAAISGSQVRVTPSALQTALGWELKPQGLCKDDRCIPTGRHAERINVEGIDLGAFAEVIGRPLALDVDERVACFGASAVDRAAQLISLAAPDFTLPDPSGTPHALSDYRGKKVLLVAYASW